MTLNLEALIKRLEECTGANRDIDYEIYSCVPVEEFDDLVPRYTSSIDAALTLMLEGWTRSVDATMPEAGIDVRLYSDSDLSVFGTHGHEEIATCIACLKARQKRGIRDTSQD